jgi:hypothetical protein
MRILHLSTGLIFAAGLRALPNLLHQNTLRTLSLASFIGDQIANRPNEIDTRTRDENSKALAVGLA